MIFLERKIAFWRTTSRGALRARPKHHRPSCFSTSSPNVFSPADYVGVRRVRLVTYRRRRETIYPIKPTDRTKFLARLDAHPDFMPMYGLDPRRVVLFLWHTGCHPDVLVHPVLRMLHVDLETGMITWARPKNDKAMGIPVHPDIRPWVADFVEALKKNAPACGLGMNKREGGRSARVVAAGDGTTRTVKDTRPYCFCYQRVERIVKRVTRDIPGFEFITARTIRHTFSSRVWKRSGHDLDELKKWTGTTSPDVAIRYVEAQDSELGKDFADGKF